MPETTLKGRIIEVGGGAKSIRSNYKYAFISIRIQVDNLTYSFQIKSSFINKYGFIPKVGQWVLVKGFLTSEENFNVDKAIKRVTLLKHIENPKRKKNNVFRS